MNGHIEDFALTSGRKTGSRFGKLVHFVGRKTKGAWNKVTGQGKKTDAAAPQKP